jgi:hypothetical protein
LREKSSFCTSVAPDLAIQAGQAQSEFLRVQCLDTITAEDRPPLYKLFAMRWRVEE